MAIYLLQNATAGDPSNGESLVAQVLQLLEQRGIEVTKKVNFEQLDEIPPATSDQDLLIVAGGDGTVNTGACVAWQKGYQLLPLPCGTANDFCSKLGITADPSLILQLIHHRPTQHVDIVETFVTYQGEETSQVTLNACHVGAGARLLDSLEKNKTTKRKWGKFGYVRQLFSEKVTKLRGFHCTVTIEGGNESQWRGRAVEILLANSGQFGGGHQLPEASYNSGKLHLLIIRPASWPIILWYWLTLRFRKYQNHSPLHAVEATSVHISTHSPQAVSNDGDLIGSTPCRATVHPKALTVVSDGLERE